MNCAHYFREICDLHSQDYVEVHHDPMSERYFRAARHLDSLLRESACIGFFKNGLNNENKYVEIVVWNDPFKERFTRVEFGEYAVFKTYYFYQDRILIPKVSQLFCFYDDKPDRNDTGNVGLKSRHEALAFMTKFNKYSRCETF